MAHALYDMLTKLDSAGVHYTLGRYRDDFVTVHVAVPGSRYEFEVSSDGCVLVSSFQGDESLGSAENILEQIIGSD